MTESLTVKPWYRQAWAWFVLAPLILIFFVCMALLTIAFKQADDVVKDNYYKEGRMINQRIEEDQVAKSLNLNGELQFDLMVGEVMLTLSSNEMDTLPETVLLYLDHPVEADYDFSLELRRVSPGYYTAALESRIAHRWYVRLLPKIIDPAIEKSWRIVGELNMATSERLVFGVHE